MLFSSISSFSFLSAQSYTLTDGQYTTVQFGPRGEIDSLLNLSDNVGIDFGGAFSWSVGLFAHTESRPIDFDHCENYFSNLRPQDFSFIDYTTSTSLDTFFQHYVAQIPGTLDDSVRITLRWWLEDSLGLMGGISAQVTPDSFALWSVQFPDLGLPQLGTDLDDDFLAMPAFSGILLPAPLDTLDTLKTWRGFAPDLCEMVDTARGGGLDGQYPAEMTMQFLAYYDHEMGLYFQTFDTTGRAIFFSAAGNPQAQKVALGAAHVRENCDVPSAGWWTVPETINLRAYRGDWYDASVFYREWGLAQSWAAKGTLADRRTEFDSTEVIFASDAPLFDFDFGAMRTAVDSLAGFWGTGHNYVDQVRSWGKMYQIGQTAPIARPGFGDYVTQSRAAGRRIAPYTPTRHWKGPLPYPVNTSAMAVNPDGFQYNNTIFGPVLYPSDTAWVRYYLDIVDTLLAYDITDLYVDNVPNAKLDWGAGRPAGGGNSWMDGFLALSDTLIAHVDAALPNPKYFQEGKAETELGRYDAVYAANWEIAVFAADYVTGGAFPIPLLAAVYGDHVGLGGGSALGLTDTLRTSADKWRLVTAFSWLYCNQLLYSTDTVLTGPGPAPADLDALTMMDDLLDLAAVVYDWKQFGTFWRPPDITADSVAVEFPVYTRTETGDSLLGLRFRDVPAVQGSAHVLEDEALFLFVNHSAVPQTFQVMLDLPEYTPFRYRWLATPAGLSFLDVTGNMVAETVTLGAREAIGWLFRDSTVQNLPATAPEMTRLAIAPNPFAEETRVTLKLPNAGTVSVTVTDFAGRPVESLYRGHMEAGTHRLRLPGDALPAGLYFVCLQSENGQVVRRALRMR